MPPDDESAEPPLLGVTGLDGWDGLDGLDGLFGANDPFVKGYAASSSSLVLTSSLRRGGMV